MLRKNCFFGPLEVHFPPSWQVFLLVHLNGLIPLDRHLKKVSAVLHRCRKTSPMQRSGSGFCSSLQIENRFDSQRKAISWMFQIVSIIKLSTTPSLILRDPWLMRVRCLQGSGSIGLDDWCGPSCVSSFDALVISLTMFEKTVHSCLPCSRLGKIPRLVLSEKNIHLLMTTK